MRRVAAGMTVVAAAMTMAGCRSPLLSGAQYDPAAPLPPAASFTWDEPDGLPTGDPRLDNNPFFVARLHGAIERELASRGIQLRASAPALLVHHHASVQTKVEVLQADQQAGYTMSPYGPGTQVYQYDEGTFLIDIADARTKQIVWRGWARVDLAAALEDPKTLAELTDDAVRAMFEHFPVPVGSAPIEEPIIEPVPPIDRIPPPDIAGRRNP